MHLVGPLILLRIQITFSYFSSNAAIFVGTSEKYRPALLFEGVGGVIQEATLFRGKDLSLAVCMFLRLSKDLDFFLGRR